MFPMTVFMTYKMTKLVADWQASKELAENPIIEEDQVVKLEDADFSER